MDTRRISNKVDNVWKTVEFSKTELGVRIKCWLNGILVHNILLSPETQVEFLEYIEESINEDLEDEEDYYY
jgi:hypothetical protein